MGIDVLILNTGVVDFRRVDFGFADELVGEGGLAKCKIEDRPSFSQVQLAQWIKEGLATCGGPGNSAPLMAKAGLKVAVGVNLGRGDYDGLDAQGRFFYDLMAANGVDMSATYVHPDLPTATTYIHQTKAKERGGIAYFPGASDQFDFEIFKKAIERLEPKIIHYVYSGLSDRGDANEGRDLAEFVRWCRQREIVTAVDTTTFAADPQEVIRSGRAVPQYRLLEPVLPQEDIFFVSSDEAKMIENTLSGPRDWRRFSEDENAAHFLDLLSKRFWLDNGRTRVFGVTFSKGAYEKHIRPDGSTSTVSKIESRFLAGDVVDLVGAGDALRAGLITYISRNLNSFHDGSFNLRQALQMGNLFAALYIKAPLDDRYGVIRSYDRMLTVVSSDATYASLNALQAALG
jgi:sugar/nucleoside kinase (ribokinase family)